MGRPPQVAITESYNGTNWTEVADLNEVKQQLGGCGASNTSALAFGGEVAPNTANTELWNGSSWTEVANLNETKNSPGSLGIVTAALAFGGNPGSKSNTEISEEFLVSNPASMISTYLSLIRVKK